MKRKRTKATGWLNRLLQLVYVVAAAVVICVAPYLLSAELFNVESRWLAVLFAVGFRVLLPTAAVLLAVIVNLVLLRSLRDHWHSYGMVLLHVICLVAANWLMWPMLYVLVGVLIGGWRTPVPITV